MVAQLLRLRLSLLANSFRRGAWQRFGVTMAALYAIVVTVIIVTGLVGLRLATPDIAHVVLVVFGSIVVLAFLLLPLVFGVDDPLDPRRFALFGIPTVKLAYSTAIASLASVPAILLLIVEIGQIVVWSRGGEALVAFVGAILTVLMCVLGSRVSSAIASYVLASRRSRDISGIVLVLVLALAAPAIALLASVDWESRGIPTLRRIASVAGWTPFGAAWSAPGDAAAGNPGEAAAKLAIAAGFVLLLAVAWLTLVAVMSAHTQRLERSKVYSGLGWFARVPATQTWAIAARSLSYWGRDSRYSIAIIVIPVVPIIAVVALMVGGISPWIVAWVPVPIMCLFLGWLVHNDVAFDSSAFWTHVAAGVRGTADRLGRLIPALLVGIPLVLIGSSVTSMLTRDWATFPAHIGLSSVVLLSALGISSIVSVAFPYAAVRPGDSPFAQPQSTGRGGSLVQGIAFFGAIATALPVVWMITRAVSTDDNDWYLWALGAGLGIGVVVLVAGVFIGGAVLKRRGPELLAFTLQN